MKMTKLNAKCVKCRKPATAYLNKKAYCKKHYWAQKLKLRSSQR